MKGARNFIAVLTNKKDETPKTLISLGPNIEEFSYSTVEKPAFEVMEKYYKDFQAFTSINLNSAAIMGEGFILKGNNESAIKLCNSVQKLSSFQPALVEGIANTMLYGTGMLELVWSKDKKKITRLKLIDIKTVDLKWDKFGNITKLKQKPVTGASGDSEPVILKPDEFMVIRFFRVADSIYGVGLIEIVMDLLDCRKEMLKRICEIIRFLALTPVHVKKHGAKNRAELTQVEESLKDFHKKHYFCTSEKYEIVPIEMKRAIPDLSNYLDKIDQYLSIALRIPMKVLSGDVNFTTEAASLALREYNQDEKTYFRAKIAIEIQDQILKPLCLANGFKEDDVPRVVWKSDVAEDPMVASRVMLNKARMLKIAEGIEDPKSKEIIQSIIDKL